MRHIYLFCLIFIPTCYSQLSVSPSSIGDSYIFVNDQVLFVEKDLHLEKNKDPKTEANIYLRSEGQLIQGEKASNSNSGDGFISLFQEGTSNAFDYNYWCLPVVNNITPNNTFGATIFDPINLTWSKKANIISDLDGRTNPLSISRRWIYKYSGVSYSDWLFVGNDFSVRPGEGFTMKGVNGTDPTIINGVQNNPGNSQRYDFRGLPNDGNISIPIKQDQVVLTGNPYPSALNLKKFLFDNTASTGIAYFWDSKTNGTSHDLKAYEGGYGAYSPGANAYAPAVFKKYNNSGIETTTTGTAGAVYGREFTPIAQGFMLIGEKDGQINFKNSYRLFKKENPENSQFKKPTDTYSKSTEENLKIRLNVSINDLYTRQLILVFRDDSTPFYDRAMDAENFGELDNDAGWLIDNKAYLINVLPLAKADSIPLRIRLSNDLPVEFNLEIVRSEGAPEYFLYDYQENTYHNISNENLRIDLAKGEYNNRFFLSRKKAMDPTPGIPTAIDQIAYLPETSERISVFQNNPLAQLEINFQNSISNIVLVGLYNLNGQLIYRKKLFTQEKNLDISTSNMSNAVYIVKLTDSSGKTFYKKISVRN